MLTSHCWLVTYVAVVQRCWMRLVFFCVFDGLGDSIDALEQMEALFLKALNVADAHPPGVTCARCGSVEQLPCKDYPSARRVKVPSHACTAALGCGGARLEICASYESTCAARVKRAATGPV